MILFIITFSTLLFLSWKIKGNLVPQCTLGGSGLLITIIALRSHSAVSLLLFGWLIIVTAALGKAVFRIVGKQQVQLTGVEKVSTYAGLGLGGLCYLVFIFGSLNILYSWVLYLSLGLLTVGLSREIIVIGKSIWKAIKTLLPRTDSGPSTLAKFTFSSLAVFFILIFILAVAPSIHYDSLVYHLAMPEAYLQNHSIYKISGQMRSYWAHNAEMLYTLGLALHGQPLPNFIHWTFNFLTCGAIFAFGKRYFNTVIGLVSSVVFFTLPVVLWESSTAYIDLMVTFYGFMTIFFFMNWYQTHEKTWLLLAGIFAGIGLGTKINLGLVLLPLAILVFFIFIRQRKPSSEWIQTLIYFGVPILLFSMPWFIRDFLWTGNPIFPFYNGVFHSSEWYPDNMFFNFSSYGNQDGIIGFIRLPYDLIVYGGKYLEDIPSNPITFLPLMFFPWFYFASTSEEKKVIPSIYAILGIYFVLWFVIGQYIRYLLPIVPLMTILAAKNLLDAWNFLKQTLPGKPAVIARNLGILVYFICIGVLYTSFNTSLPEHFPIKYALGLESKDEYLNGSIGVYDSLQFLNALDQPNTKVLSIGNEYRSYCNMDLYTWQTSYPARLLVYHTSDAQSLYASLTQQGFKYILLNETTVISDTQLTTQPIVSAEFLDNYTALISNLGDFKIYQIK